MSRSLFLLALALVSCVAESSRDLGPQVAEDEIAAPAPAKLPDAPLLAGRWVGEDDAWVRSVEITPVGAWSMVAKVDAGCSGAACPTKTRTGTLATSAAWSVDVGGTTFRRTSRNGVAFLVTPGESAIWLRLAD